MHRGEGEDRGEQSDTTSALTALDLHWADAVSAPLKAGPYVWGRQLGRGGMAHVHLARRAHDEDFTEYAAKRMLPEYAARPRFARMFWVEASICMMLQHPNIVRALDFGAQDDELVLLLEYVEGVSCGYLLRAAASREEGLPTEVALFMATEVLKALEYAHDAVGPTRRPLGIVHRDVSPGNILVSEDGAVKLTDFGVARLNDRPDDTRPGTLKGKFGYMSPEQIAGVDVDRRTDVFSLGVVLYEMLTGKPLFTGRSDFEVLTRTYEADLAPLAHPAHGLPLELKLILATALAREPGERFQTAGDFLAALESFARHAKIPVNEDALRGWLTLVGVVPSRSGTFHAAAGRWKPQGTPEEELVEECFPGDRRAASEARSGGSGGVIRSSPTPSAVAFAPVEAIDPVTRLNIRVARRYPALTRHFLGSHSWPGNVRELQNCVESAAVFTHGESIEFGDLPAAIRGAYGKGSSLGLLQSDLVTDFRRLPRAKDRGAIAPRS